MTPFSNEELERITREYSRRDRLGCSRIYTYTNPAYLFHIQEREWAILQLLKEEGIELKGLSILDVGCGTGNVLHRFIEFGARSANGIDLMESRIKIAKERYPHLQLVRGNAAQLPYARGSFDLVMQFMCLSSVLDQNMRKEIANEMWRVLRPGGALLFYDLRPRPLTARLLFRFFSVLKRVLKLLMREDKNANPSIESYPPTPIKPLTLKEIKNLFSRDPVKWRVVSLDFNLSWVAGKIRFLAYLLTYLVFLRTHYLVLFRKISCAGV
ncbi:MAG: class I SAM-dependent methyltransferase [Thermodesulfobacteriota bacterium]